jgi:hypothetical protein
MVLENASDSTSDDFTDRQPANDNDSYSSSDSQRAFYVEGHKYPQPMPIFGALFGYNTAFVQKVLQARIQGATNLMHRAPTEEEVDAFAYWTMKQISLASYGGPLGIAVASWRAYQTAPIFRFPFYAPNLEKLNTNVWPTPKMPYLAGGRAVMAWHACRLLAYGFAGHFVGNLLGISYSMSVATVGQSQDPRLRDFTDSIRKRAIEARKLPTPAQPQPQGQVGAIPEQDTTAGWQDVSGSTSESPISATTYSSTRSDETVRVPQTDRRSSGRIRPLERSTEPVENSQTGMDLFDTLGNVTQTTASGAEEARAVSRSAWDRVRQRTNVQSSGGEGSSWTTSDDQAHSEQPRRAGRDRTRHEKRNVSLASTTDDSYSYSKSEEDRQLAREEAQKEFDARVEQERRGGDFGGDSSNQKRPW